MSWLSKLTGRDAARNAQRAADRQNATIDTQATQVGQQAGQLWGGLTGQTPMVGQDAFAASFKAAMDAAMPQFQSQLQGVRESAIRRGISTGDLGTSYEGDLASAFQRNTANAAASQAMGLFTTNANLYQGQQGTYLDLLTGQRDAKQDQANAAKRRSAGILGGLGSLAGAGIGGALGGSAGAQLGAGIGGSLLGSF